MPMQSQSGRRHWYGSITMELAGMRDIIYGPVIRSSHGEARMSCVGLIGNQEDMSIEENEAEAQLRREFESYLKGQEPSLLELEGAPLLENWRTAMMQFKRRGDPLRMILVLVGSVAGHPQHADSRTIRTSQLIWLDRNRKWARTWNRVYRLGERASIELDAGGEGVGA
jgi:hypothetical protein